jgi:hypothetical protein
MDPLALKIRGNLHKFRQQTQAQYLKEWKIIQVVNLLAALILMLVALFPALWPVRHAVQVLIYAPLLIITSLFFLLKTCRESPGAINPAWNGFLPCSVWLRHFSSR